MSLFFIDRLHVLSPRLVCFSFKSILSDPVSIISCFSVLMFFFFLFSVQVYIYLPTYIHAYIHMGWGWCDICISLESAIASIKISYRDIPCTEASVSSTRID